MEHFEVQLGHRRIWGGEEPFGLFAGDRRQHLYLVGQTGTGKSTLMRELIAQDIQAGRGVALIDPHGDLAHEVLDRVPPRRQDEVVVLDPSDIEYPVLINPFYRVPKDERSLQAANFVGAMKHVWRDSWGPRLEYILYNTVAAILDAPDYLRPSLLSLPLVLVRRDYRRRLVRCVEDARVRSFFEDEFETWSERQLAEHLSSVQNKIGQVLSNPFIRNILGSWRPTVDLREIVESRKILIVRLSKGTLGEEPANLLGSLVATGLYQAALRRAGVPETARNAFHLYIDEFQNFTTDTFSGVLSEARKYGLALTIGHQFHDQLEHGVRAAVFGNVGSMICYRVSGADAERMALEFGTYAPAAFRDLGRGEICARFVEGGQSGVPFMGRTEPNAARVYGRGPIVMERSRRRFANSRVTVEKRIARGLWHS